MIRPDLGTETVVCHTCHRDGHVRKLNYALTTVKESVKLYGRDHTKFDKELTPAMRRGKLVCSVNLGSSVWEAVKEAKGLAKISGKNVIFVFNGRILEVDENFDETTTNKLMGITFDR